MSNRLKQLREENGLSLIEMSEKTGFPYQTLRNYEIEKRQPKRDVWDKLADFFEVSTAYIMGLSSERKVIDWGEYDSKLTDSHFCSINIAKKGLDLDNLDESIELRIDEKPLSKEERKALALFIGSLKELRK